MLPSQNKSKFEQDRKLAGDHCAVLTGPGRSAIAVIGLRGATADQIVRRCFTAVSSEDLFAGQVRYGSWKGPGGAETAGESVVLTPSADEHFEIHCHGGPAAVGRIIADLVDCGAIQIESANWRYLENRLIDEAQLMLSRCLTSRTAAIAMDQARGAMADWVTDWIKKLNPEPMAPVSNPENRILRPETESANTLAGLQREARSILACAPVTIRLANPFQVVLVGPPNVGKSSLVNAILGFDRSITFDQAGTTRDVLHADTVIDGFPIRLSDTAGIRDSNQAIERQGIARARAAAAQADLILNVFSPESHSLDLGRGFGDETDADLEGCPTILRVFNKMDLLDPNCTTPANAISTNAMNGNGIPGLLQTIGETFGKTIPLPGKPAPLCQRQVGLLNAIAESHEPEQSLNLLQELLGRSAVSGGTKR